MAINKVVTAVIDTFIKSEKTFSAYDVTKTIRDMGVYCMHNALKPNIHKIMIDVMNDGGSTVYKKTLVDNGMYHTFVYHPSDVDPHGYNSTTDPTTLDTSQTLTKTIDLSSKMYLTTVSRDKRGRICIPANMLRDIGAQTGTKVAVTTQDGKVVIVKYDSDTMSSKSNIYGVDRDNNVRISAGVFVKANLGASWKMFNVLKCQEQIEVTERVDSD